MSKGLLAGLSIMAMLGIAAAPSINILPSQSWHDQARLIQIGLIGLATLVILLNTTKQQPSLPSCQTATLLTGILLLAALSSYFAHQPLWAFTEVSLFIGCTTLTIASFQLRRLFHKKFDKFLITAMCFVIIGILLKFIAGYSAAQAFHATLQPIALLDGFNNLRFLGQFQTLSLPILVLPLLLQTSTQRIKAIFFGLLIAWWIATITSGTRACFLAMACAVMVMIFLGPQARRWCYLQMAALAIAIPLFCLMMFWLPPLLGNPPLMIDDRFFSTSLSLRDILWKLAISLIKTYPWLGIGPMHYADQTVVHVAHPHNAILLWAVEWGIPSLILVIALLSPFVFSVLRTCSANKHDNSQSSALRLCLLAALLASAAQSMVDGVTVMPYTQLWLAVMAGWIWSLQPHPLRAGKQIRPDWLGRSISAFGLVTIISSSSLLAYVAWRDYPTLAALNTSQNPYRPGKGTDPPRFWLRGSIANPDLPGSYGFSNGKP